MNQTTANGLTNETKPATTVADRCLASCRKILAEISRTKQAILAESSAAIGVHRQVLRLALNEAEALAWQTKYPLLIFPTLAAEKARAVAVWGARQQALRSNRRIAFAPAA